MERVRNAKVYSVTGHLEWGWVTTKRGGKWSERIDQGDWRLALAAFTQNWGFAFVWSDVSIEVAFCWGQWSKFVKTQNDSSALNGNDLLMASDGHVGTQFFWAVF